MNPPIDDFKECAHQAGQICGCSPTKLIRGFGLEDFLENKLEDDDDAGTIAIKAIEYFCDDFDSHALVCQFAVLTVGIFLKSALGKGKQIPEQALRDLKTILTRGATEGQLRRWIASHFP